MNKKSVLWIILDLIFLAVFNTVFFVAGGAEHVASVWIAYGFIHFAYLMVLVTPFLIRKSSSAAVFGFSLYSISSAYFLLALVIGVVFILIGSDSYKASLIVQIIVAGLYGVLLVSHLLANEHTADNIARHEAEIAFIKTASSEVKALVDKASDKQANKEIERAYDILHASPSKSNPSVHSIESNVLAKIAELKAAVAAQDTAAIITTAGEIITLTEERNRALQLAN